MKCLVDNQLPPALARFLSSRGIEAEHVADIGLTEAADRQIWKYVTDTDCVLISKDEDFLNFVSQSKTGKFIWVRTGNSRRAALLLIFENLWAKIEDCVARGDRVIEIR